MNDIKSIIEDCHKSDLVSEKVIRKIIEINRFKAFPAGLKAGRPQWHKVEEKLPPLGEGCERLSLRVVDNYNRIICYDYDSKRWRDLEGDSLGIQPDYWCEIPMYTDE